MKHLWFLLIGFTFVAIGMALGLLTRFLFDTAGTTNPFHLFLNNLLILFGIYWAGRLVMGQFINYLANSKNRMGNE